MEKVSQPLIIMYPWVKRWCCFCCICLGKEAQMLFQSPFISMASNHFPDLGLQGRWKQRPLGSDFQSNGETEHMPISKQMDNRATAVHRPYFLLFLLSVLCTLRHYSSPFSVASLEGRGRSLVFSKNPSLTILQFRVAHVHKPSNPPV